MRHKIRCILVLIFVSGSNIAISSPKSVEPPSSISALASKPALVLNKNDEYYARIVISKMLRKIPDSVKKVCVINDDQRPIQQVLRLEGVDRRIVNDVAVCSNTKDSWGTVYIYYHGKINVSIKGFEKYWKYFVIGANFDGCGAEEEAFIFKRYADGVKLIGYKVIGRIECVEQLMK